MTNRVVNRTHQSTKRLREEAMLPREKRLVKCFHCGFERERYVQAGLTRGNVWVNCTGEENEKCYDARRLWANLEVSEYSIAERVSR